MYPGENTIGLAFAHEAIQYVQYNIYFSLSLQSANKRRYFLSHIELKTNGQD